MLHSYLDLNFEVIKGADTCRYGNVDDIRFILLGSIGLFINIKLSTSSGKHLEDISHAHIVSLLYKFITSAKDSEDLSVGFDRYRARRRD